jgi:hypothetical protein
VTWCDDCKFKIPIWIILNLDHLQTERRLFAFEIPRIFQRARTFDLNAKSFSCGALRSNISATGCLQIKGNFCEYIQLTVTQSASQLKSELLRRAAFDGFSELQNCRMKAADSKQRQRSCRKEQKPETWNCKRQTIQSLTRVTAR